MTRRSSGLKIGRIAGAPVLVTPSWFLAAAVLTVLFASNVRTVAPALESVGVIGVALALVLLLFASVFCHEVAHALVARRLGHRVDELALTMWGGHTAYSGAARRPAHSALIAVVGPLTNLALAAALWFAFTAQSTASLVAVLLYLGALANAFVGAFNLLPGLPLDGGQVLEAGVWAVTGDRTRGTVAAGWIGRCVGVGVVVLALAWPLVEGRPPSWVTVMVAALIGAFLWSGATEAMRSARHRAQLAGLSVRALATPAVVVPGGATVADATGRAGVVVVVDADGRPVGWVDPQAAADVPAAETAAIPVEAVIVPFPAGAEVDVEATGPDLLHHLAATSRGARLVPVLDVGRVVGVLDVARVATAVRPPERK